MKRQQATRCSYPSKQTAALAGKPPVGLLWVSLVALAAAALLVLNGAVGAASGGGQQRLEAQPEVQYLIPQGHDKRLACSVRNRQGDCSWLRNGRNIGIIPKKYNFLRQPVDGDCGIWIRNVTVQHDDGIWQCQVSAPEVDAEPLLTRETNLIVLVAPEKPQLKNMAQAAAPSSSSQQQQQQQAQLQRTTQSRLRLGDIKRNMNGKNLTCVGVHPTGGQSTSVELDVQYVPTVSVAQREYSIVEGSPLSISCQVDSNPAPAQVNWRQLGQAAGLAKSQLSRNGPLIEFGRVGRELNQQTFECLAQNSLGVSQPAEVRLNVLFPPSVANTSGADSVIVGQEAKLACNAAGNPPPDLRWYFLDPLSRSELPVPLETSPRQTTLVIRNVTYRNEGDYLCELSSKINGVLYGAKSQAMPLDVYGEPQFLTKLPVHSKAVQGTRSELALTFCSDPPPNKVFWQFGSIRLDVRLRPAEEAPPGEAKQSPIGQRFQAHPLRSLQKLDAPKAPTCFEAQLSILEPELTDQRDYSLVVQNERGHQMGTLRLRVSSPLSPVLMITSAFVTICGLFLCSLLAMFLLKKRRQFGSNQPDGSQQTNGAANGLGKGSVEHLANGNQRHSLAGANGAASALNGAKQQQTRGLVNGAGNGLANGAGNPAALGADELGKNLLSMASSDSSSGDQKQLLAGSDRNLSGAGSSPSQCADYQANGSANSTDRSTANSSPSPMTHISVDDELHLGAGSTYQAAECVTRDAQLSPVHAHNLNGAGALIYANLADYADHNSMVSRAAANTSGLGESSPTMSPAAPALRRQQTPMGSPTGSSLNSDQSSSLTYQANQARVAHSPGGGLRPNVGATIAMMNKLAAASSQATSSPTSGVLNGAINQQLANSRQVRKPGPPKPPKPSIQQRSRFYQQQQQQQGLVMIGAPQANYSDRQPIDAADHNELAVEYSRIAFPARAEL